MPTILNQDLHNKISNLNSFIKNNHDATAFIYFKVNDFELDTRSTNSRNHYAISLSNQKTGVGAGNQFTLKISYHKDFSDFESANKLEKALSCLRQISLATDNQQAVQNLNNGKNDCILKYGYLDEAKISATPKYVGKLLQYTVTANKQILTYTLKGYTGEQATVGTVNWYPKIALDNDKNWQIVDGEQVIVAKIEEKIKTESLTKSEIKEYIEDLNRVYKGSIYVNPYLALKAFIADYNNDIDKMPNVQNPTKFNVIDKSGLLSNEYSEGSYLKPVRLSICRNQTPIDYVQYLVSMFSERAKDYAVEYLKEQMDITDRWVYELKRDTTSNIINIEINKISSVDADTYTYNFEGYSANNVLLIDYNLDYDGTVALSVANTMNSEDKNNAIYIRSDGLISAKASITNEMFVEGAISDVLVKRQNEWIDKISCANSCTLKTFGMPFEIPVSTVFSVSFNIKDEYHHTSGRCYVTGIVDNIENNMFTTNFSMVRLPGKGAGVETI